MQHVTKHENHRHQCIPSIGIPMPLDGSNHTRRPLQYEHVHYTLEDALKSAEQCLKVETSCPSTRSPAQSRTAAGGLVYVATFVPTQAYCALQEPCSRSTPQQTQKQVTIPLGRSPRNVPAQDRHSLLHRKRVQLHPRNKHPTDPTHPVLDTGRPHRQTSSKISVTLFLVVKCSSSGCWAVTGTCIGVSIYR